MAGPVPQSQSQTYTSAEEEALKRNTDCVYFLASPLTCKKGSECEFRHSDVARLNPRDCWFWLNGNCLNSKCAFRHPPLDGLLVTETPMSNGPSLPTLSTTTAHVPSASGKQAVACVFFQSGYCVKGDWCPFLHAPPNSTFNKGSLMPGAASAAEPATSKKAFNGLEKFAQEKKAPPTIIDSKSNKVPPQVKPPAVKAGPIPPRNDFSVNRRMPPTTDVNEFSGHRNVPSSDNVNSRAQQPNLLDEPGIVNQKDAEEVSREHSPGFDVLVDDEGRDDEYYPSEDQYGMSREHETGNDYDVGRSTDYNKIADVDNGRYQDPLGYDSREHFKGQYGWEHRSSSERMSGGPSYPERRPYPRTDTLAQVDELDLRHRLVKHKKANGLRSVISQEHTIDRYTNDRSYQGSRRDDQPISRHENSLGSRLRGRIRLPERPSPTDRSVDHRRLSPARPIMSSHLGRVRDRIQDRAEEAAYNGGRNHRGMQSRRGVMDDNSANFSGPKSLAELKKRKSSEHSGPDRRSAECSRYDVPDQQSLGKRKHVTLDSHQPSVNDLSFEGPKPLQEILKRKKGETTGALSGGNLSNSEDIVEVNNQNEELDTAKNEITTLEPNNQLGESAGESKLPALDSVLEPVGDLGAEDGMIVEEESEAYEQRDGESDEDLDLYGGENGDAEEVEYYDEEEEEVDDDEDDDFAKKMGVKYA